MPTPALLQDYPWAQAPIIVNAPTSGIATSELAATVTRASGLGLIGFLDTPTCSTSSSSAQKSCYTTIKPRTVYAFDTAGANADANMDILPVGVGVIVAASLKTWTKEIRATSPLAKIWVQVGTVAAALGTARACHHDVLVLQGCRCSGENGFEGVRRIPLVATGGIMDGRGVAVAITLGASGVVMGTRFFLSASDGGRGVPIEEFVRGCILRLQTEDDGFRHASSLWAGAGVGLVRSIEEAGDIVETMREGARQRLLDTYVGHCRS
ncbi:hypothetical protein BDV10DRAFT_198735 [Aspergillus recurvatus]